MSARILVVDDIETNRRLLEARLAAEYFDVVEAPDGQTCIEYARRDRPDLILLDVMMPGLDGFETCRRLKADPVTRHIPVVMVTALDQRTDRIRGLEAGADEFLTKPVDDVALFARVRSLLRLKVVMDELRLREGVREPEEADAALHGGRVMIAAGEPAIAQRLAASLPEPFDVTVLPDPRDVVREAERADLVLVDLSRRDFDGMRLCARIRSEAATRQTPILGVVSTDDRRTMVRALDLGVNDVILRPVDAGELVARARTQLKRKLYTDALRDRLEESLEMAVKDSLTGLFNRRYALSRLRQSLDGLERNGEPVSVALIDLDHFKRVNDTFGHQSGDEVLRRFAELVARELRAVDIAARFGGEEFVIVFNGANGRDAQEGAERVRAAIARERFHAPGGEQLFAVTISAGVAEAQRGETPEGLLARADAALYEAKASGRNQVLSANKKAA